MATTTTSRTAWSVLATACNLYFAAAQTLATNPSPSLNLSRLSLDSEMKLSLRPSESGPVTEEYSVVPLTVAARLNQSTGNGVGSDITPPRRIQGKMVLVDQSNYNAVNDNEAIAYVSCDSEGQTDSYIDPDDILDVLVRSDIKAILLYSIERNYCDITGRDIDNHNIWSMTTSDEAQSARNTTEASTGAIIATIERSGDSSDMADYPPSKPEGGNNSAVAMSVLYSITGIITLLFLVIIGSGALRAHRHPERYGPRPSFGGRPRQSRAKGLARAVLDTIPIVKFGDSSRPTKPDPEHELESAAGDGTRATDPTPNEPGTEATRHENAPPDANTTNTTEPETADSNGPQETRTSSSDPVGDENVGCSICTEDFTVGEDVRVLPCDHKFHPQCVDPWLVNVSGTCPLCRLDLRPQSSTDGEADIADESLISAHQSGDDADASPNPTSISPSAPAESDTEMSGAHLGANLNVTQQNQRRRRSRFLPDWNRLRHASVDERIQALRQYRQSEQQETADATAGGSDGPGAGTTHDRTGHMKLTGRLREKFRILTHPHTHANTQMRTQADTRDDSASDNPTQSANTPA